MVWFDIIFYFVSDSNHQTTVEWRPNWYRLEAHSIYIIATDIINMRVPCYFISIVLSSYFIYNSYYHRKRLLSILAC